MDQALTPYKRLFPKNNNCVLVAFLLAQDWLKSQRSSRNSYLTVEYQIQWSYSVLWYSLILWKWQLSLVDVGCLFFYINHTKPNYILVADKCQSNYVEYNYNPITISNRRKNILGFKVSGQFVHRLFSLYKGSPFSPRRGSKWTICPLLPRRTMNSILLQAYKLPRYVPFSPQTHRCDRDYYEFQRDKGR